MQKLITIILLAGSACLRADEVSDLENLVRVMKALEQQPQQQADLYEQLRAIEIRTAYPQNPQMWRYLERNPRMQPYYLGY